MLWTKVIGVVSSFRITKVKIRLHYLAVNVDFKGDKQIIKYIIRLHLHCLQKEKLHFHLAQPQILCLEKFDHSNNDVSDVVQEKRLSDVKKSQI